MLKMLLYRYNLHVIYLKKTTLSMSQLSAISTDLQLEKSHQLTHAITLALSQFIVEANPFILFNGLLEDLLRLTDSEYGFIGEVLYSMKNNETSQPYIQCYATTNISWSEQTRALYAQTAEQGMKFSRLNSLYGEVLKTGRYVIANDPGSDPRSGGLPPGHPPLNKFLGLPFFSGKRLLGVVGIANRAAGYDEALIHYLEPFLSTCGNLIQAYKNNQHHQLIEVELESYKRRLAALNRKNIAGNLTTMQASEHIVLGEYVYRPQDHNLMRNNQVIPLSKKESLLLHLLATRANQIIEHQIIEAAVWENVIVSESSLRALVLRLRKKLPGLTIKTLTGVGFMLCS